MDINIRNPFKKLQELYKENNIPVRANIGVMENIAANMVDEAIEINAQLFADYLDDLLKEQDVVTTSVLDECVRQADEKSMASVRDDVLTRIRGRSWMNETTFQIINAQVSEDNNCTCGQLLDIIYSSIRDEKPHTGLIEALDLKWESFLYVKTAEVIASYIENHPALSVIHVDTNSDRQPDQTVIMNKSEKLHMAALEKHLLQYERDLLEYEGLSRSKKNEGILISRMKLIQNMTVEIAKEIPEGLKRDKYLYRMMYLMKTHSGSLSVRDLLYDMNQTYIYVFTGESRINEDMFVHRFEEMILMVELATGNEGDNVKEWKGIRKSSDYLLHYIKARRHVHEIEKKAGRQEDTDEQVH